MWNIVEYMHQKFHIPEENLGVIAGPCHAEEIALERLSYLTVGCKDIAKAREWSKLFDTPYVRTTPSNDVEGLEYASVMKNIYAIAAGICKSLHYGDNFLAVLLTNAMHEMIRFAKAKSEGDRGSPYCYGKNSLTVQLAARNPTKSAINAAGTAYLVLVMPQEPK